MSRAPAPQDTPPQSPEPQPEQPVGRRSRIPPFEVIFVMLILVFAVLTMIFVIWNVAKFLRFDLADS